MYPPSFLGGKAKHAVRGLTLGCPAGERFGFLGINGAGKSSTLNVLTGDISPTSGEIFIAGHPLSDPKVRLPGHGHIRRIVSRRTNPAPLAPTHTTHTQHTHTHTHTHMTSGTKRGRSSATRPWA